MTLTPSCHGGYRGAALSHLVSEEPASGNQQILETEDIPFDEAADFDELLEGYEQTEEEANANENDAEAGIADTSGGVREIGLDLSLSKILSGCLEVFKELGMDIPIATAEEDESKPGIEGGDLVVLSADCTVGSCHL